jgi:hypothetical protein
MPSPDDAPAHTAATRARLASVLAVAALLGASFAVQAHFFRQFPQPSLFGDPAGYYALGQNLREGLALLRAEGWRAAFEHVRGGFDFLGIGLIFALLPSDRPGDVAWFRLLLAGINTLGMLGACLLARRSSGSLAAGLLAVVVALLHPSFSTDVGRLYPEPIVGCLCVWAAYFYTRGVDEGRARSMAAAGLLLFGALLVRAKLMPYLLALAGLALLVSLPAWGRKPRARRLVGAFLLGALPLVALWAGARRAAQGSVDAKVPEWNLPSRHYYPYGFWQYIDSDGWEGPYRLKTEPYYRALVAASRSDPELMRSRARQWLFTLRYIGSRPLESLSVVLDNAWRLYDHPHNPYRWDYPLDYGRALALHRGVVVLGLAGLLLWALGSAARAGIAFVPLSLLLIYGLAFPYPRYALPGLLILCASAPAFVAACLTRLRGASLRPPAVALAVGLALTGLARLAFLPLPELARWLGWLGLLAVLGTPLLLAAAVSPSAPRRWPAAVAVWAGLACLLTAHALRDRAWHETETPLGSDTLGARQELELDAEALAALRSAGEAFVAFDLSVPRGDTSVLSLDVGGHALAGEALQPTMPRLPEQTTTGGRDWRGYRQWWALPLRSEWLPASPAEPLRLELRARPGAEVVLRGDRYGGQQRVYAGPSFGDWPHAAGSKLEHDGDYRIPVRRPLMSRATRSFVLGVDGNWEPRRALHRVRVVTLGANEGRLTWRTPPLPKAPRLALAFAGSSAGRARTAEVEFGGLRLRGFPLASERDFALDQPPLRLCFQALGRRGEHPYGAYVLTAPGVAAGATQPMAVRFFTGMRDEPVLFALDTRPPEQRPRADAGAGCELPEGTLRVEAYGSDLDARHNNYPQDTGRWRVEQVY